MNNVFFIIGKIFVYLILSIGASMLVYLGSGYFFNQFLNSIIPLLATLIAIYITSNSLIIIELNRIKEKHKEADPSSVLSEGKKAFKFQIILLLCLVIVFIIRDLIMKIDFGNENIHKATLILSNAFSIAAFSYFMESLYDTGKTLFLLLDFNNKD